MISPEPYLSVFLEVVRFSFRRTVLVFRLIVDLELFKQATEIGRNQRLIHLSTLKEPDYTFHFLNIEHYERDQMLALAIGCHLDCDGF